MSIKTRIAKLHYDKSAKKCPFLDFCSLFYGVGSGLKNKLYDIGFLKAKKVGAHVISVGNFTTGGVGKTPVVAKIAQYYVDKGEKVAIISRGYGGTLNNKQIHVINGSYTAQEAGDEPFWLAQNVPDAIVLTCSSRVKAAEYAVTQGVTKIILDDGFQHRKLHRHLDIVLIDSVKGFGNEKLLPAGPLREGTEAFSRVDKLVVVSKNTEHSRAEKYAKIMGKKLKICTVVCYTEPDFVYNIKTGEHLPEGETVTAISAIGQPQQFYDFLKGYNVVKTVDFDDHHIYTSEDLKDLSGKIITTEKDAVKLQAFDNIYALKLKTNLDLEALLND